MNDIIFEWTTQQVLYDALTMGSNGENNTGADTFARHCIWILNKYAYLPLIAALFESNTGCRMNKLKIANIVVKK